MRSMRWPNVSVETPTVPTRVAAGPYYMASRVARHPVEFNQSSPSRRHLSLNRASHFSKTFAGSAILLCPSVEGAAVAKETTK